jgi:FlaA1/EpsC-like NDP-sugar epimerase
MYRYRSLLALWLLGDLIIFLAGYALAYFMRVGFIFSTDFPFDRYMHIAIGIAPIWLLILVTTRTFSLTRNQATLRNAAYILYACITGVALFALGYYFTYGLFFSRLLLLYALALNTVIAIAWHIGYGQFLRRAVRWNPPVFRALIVGVTRESCELIRKLHAKHSPITPVAILDGKGVKEQEIDGVPVRGKLNKLEVVLEEDAITHLVQCADLEQSVNLLSACRKKGITYMLLPSVLGIVEGDERIESLEGHPVTIVAPQGNTLQWFFR